MAVNWVIAPIVRTLTNGAAGFAIGYLGGWVGGLIVGLIFLGLGALPGWCMAGARSYNWAAPVTWVEFIVDNTWGVLNGMAGSLYLAINLITLNRIAPSSAGTSALVLERGIIPGFVTTIGNVIAGNDPGIMRHEQIHILQGRIFGLIYIPSVIVNYILATIAPYWLL